MGKAKKIKQLRKIANALPGLNRKTPTSERVHGSDLIKRGITECKGELINPSIDYKEKSFKAAPVNHLREMKRHYNKSGIGGALAYAGAVHNFATSQEAAVTHGS